MDIVATFLVRVFVTVAWSASVAIRYVLPVLWMTSRVHMVAYGRRDTDVFS